MDLVKLKEELIRDEGIRAKAYLDSKGIPTIGIGHNLQKPISSAAIEQIYADDLAEVFTDLNKFLPWWTSLNLVRQRVLANMCFNMGIGTLLEFRNALGAMKAGDWFRASQEMLNSEWAKQVGARADRLAQMMYAGEELTPIIRD